MPREGEPLPVPRLEGPRRTAARHAKRLTVATWETLLRLPALCGALGVATPRWARGLLEHAEAVSRELPAEVLQPLTSPMAWAVATCHSAPARAWGVAMGVWEPLDTPAEARAWLVEHGNATPEDLDASMGLTPLGSCVRELWLARNPPEPKCSRGALLRPFKPIRPGHEPLVVEDGTKGRVMFKCEICDDGPVGPAWLVRGDRSERLFRGRWVRDTMAEQYAREHGHEFGGGG